MNVATLFVVRVWRADRSFRASVRRVDDEDTRLFHDAADLARYLESSVETSVEASVEASAARAARMDPGRTPDDEPAT